MANLSNEYDRMKSIDNNQLLSLLNLNTLSILIFVSSKLAFTFSKSTMETPEQCVNNNGNIRTMCKIC